MSFLYKIKTREEDKVKKKYFLCAIFAVCLAVMSGCGATTVNNISDNKDTTDVVADIENAETKLEDKTDYTLEDLAELNGIQVDELNIGLDEEGYVNFIGNKYCNEIIKDEIDAQNSLEHIKSILQMDDIQLVFRRSDISPTTDTTYYTFIQVMDAEMFDEYQVAYFGTNTLKVIVDKDGYTAGVSCDLKHGELAGIADERKVTPAEAEEYIQSVVGEGKNVYTENTQVAFWTDDQVPSSVGENGGKIVPVWCIYADNVDENTVQTRPYSLYVVPAIKGSGEADLITAGIYNVEKLGNVAEKEGEYTSEAFFENKEDAGEYTYDVNLEWVKISYPEYAGELSRQISVPVMYEKSTGLYYMGDYNERLSVANMYDMVGFHVLNPLVSDNPDDINSWHFENMTYSDDDGEIQYFCDPNYIVASFEAYRTVYFGFQERYGLNSYDKSGMPLLLLVYRTEGSEYPKDVSEFVVNAGNGDQTMDWGMFLTSPALAECIGMTTMFHEYTHGINGCLATTQYMNEQGAIKESYADIIGLQMAQIYQSDRLNYKWKIGADYSAGLRDFSNPRLFNQPLAIGDINYVYPVDSSLAVYLDNGGVHLNSGVLNYFAYRLLEEENLLDGEETLDVEASLDTWYELLYMSNYMTDFEAVARYMQLSSKLMGLSEGNIKLLNRLIDEHGLIDGDVDDALKNEQRVEYSINFTFEDESASQMFTMAGMLYDITNKSYYMGGLVDGSLKITLAEDSEKMPVILTGLKGQSMMDIVLFDGLTDAKNFNIVVKPMIELEAGQTFEIPKDSIVWAISQGKEGYLTSLNENGSATLDEPGMYTVITGPKDKSNTDLEMYIIGVN